MTHFMQRRLKAAAVWSLTALVLTTPAAQAYDVWAAISYSPAKNVVGVSSEEDSRLDASYKAQTSCWNQGGTDCRIVTYGRHCLALAKTSSGWYGGSSGATRAAAEQRAMQRLGTVTKDHGYIYGSFCNDGVE
jgi:hypothetical protein